MNINLHINQLILEGIELSPSQRALLQTTVESELSRLLRVNGIPQHLAQGGNITKLPTKINVTNNINPRQIGQGIARSIYQEMHSLNGNLAGNGREG